MGTRDYFSNPSFGITRVLDGVTFADAVPAVTEALKAEGFGVLTEIDVRATLKKKIDVDHRDYVILGACNPTLAHRALTAVPGVGLLMPCNVVVTVEDDGRVVVSAIDPAAMFSVVGDPSLETFAADVGQRLRRVLASI